MLIVVAAVFSLPVRAMISQTLTINSPANDDDEYPDNPHTHNDPENRLDLYAGPYLVPVSTPWLLLLSVIAICQELQKRLDAHAFPFDDNNSIVTTIFQNMVGPFTVPLWTLTFCLYRSGFHKTAWAVKIFWCIWDGMPLVQYLVQNAWPFWEKVSHGVQILRIGKTGWWIRLRLFGPLMRLSPRDPRSSIRGLFVIAYNPHWRIRLAHGIKFKIISKLTDIYFCWDLLWWQRFSTKWIHDNFSL